MSLFEKASRQKLRFKVSQGILSTEDLWDIKLEGLDSIAKGLNKELKDAEEESFIKQKSSANELLTLKFEIVKHIIKVKLDEAEVAKLSVAKQKELQRLAELIAVKENEALADKSLDELRKQYAELASN